MNNIADYFNEHGFCKIKLFSCKEVKDLEQYALDWLQELLGPFPDSLEIDNYHNWYGNLANDHDVVLTAKNRHKIPSSHIKNILLNGILGSEIIRGIIGDCKIWDEGLGWLGIRVIRPSPFEDGYDLSKKTWGPGGRLFSIYIPIFQRDKNNSIGIVRGSHLTTTFSAKLDTTGKFCKDELRLDLRKASNIDIERFEYSPGECLLTHPDLIHCEKVSPLAIHSRISFEVRLRQ